MKYKNKKLTVILVVIIMGLVGITYTNFKYSIFTFNNKLMNNKKIILIDPGHGGVDGGAVSKRGTVEKDINLKISLKLRDKLKDKGFNVVMTREEDKGLYKEKGSLRKKKVEDLTNRCNMKKESNCDVFISIHLNMFTQEKYYGAQVWYANNEDSKKLASIIQQNFKKDLDKNNKREEKPAMNSYKVLKDSEEIPSVLVECGFLSNLLEESKLKSDSYQDKIAESICKSIVEYFNK
ncbi:germination-specific N-acetylmuramoyl-L-alanine amidase precursor [Clostridium acetireducens DSM 10703]|jgi:N-acetylmuramoyl-L-alanine amidase|uniref:Germination-specific N-acetylmuramoyl-L-alanine amidase n=1 Tax=Clostridium acetireducens DSM 10703 TaxID=1121290 RepID=A0A1E8F0M0_9CLOT|nr:N-acetylmuramoyl-L-alanine amidase CwlD [Clostridium acetireducens]OFI06855.1 germination-specific N-acetylmuramoyl-L-alanine amidase precursor [Clostridium acetireducens DSM 10703]